jgi:hypothetical protein
MRDHYVCRNTIKWLSFSILKREQEEKPCDCQGVALAFPGVSSIFGAIFQRQQKLYFSLRYWLVSNGGRQDSRGYSNYYFIYVIFLLRPDKNVNWRDGELTMAVGVSVQCELGFQLFHFELKQNSS